MGSPTIFNGSFTRLLTSRGIRKSNGQLVENNGVVNFITNESAEVDTTGWATYADAAGSSPVDGTGGSPNVTWTRTTTTPLIGTASFLFTKDAANRQGQGASFDFTIDSAYQAKVLQIQFEYAVASGTFVAGTNTANSDITVWIYDVTNNQLIQPSTYRLFASSSLSTTFVSNFQTAANSTSYRLIFHCATTSASAYTVEFDDIRVSPSQYVYGTPITDWTSYTPSFTGFGSPSSIEFQWRRVGANAEIRGKFFSGTPSSTEARISLPSGLTSASTSIIPSIQVCGFGAKSATGALIFTALIEPSVTYITLGIQDATRAGLTKQNGNVITGGSETFSFQSISVPIVGWSSAVQTSDQADSRVVAARYNIAGAVSGGTTQPIDFATRVFDTHSAVTTGSAWKFTAPVAGVYEVKTSLASASGTPNIFLHKNGVSDSVMGNANGSVFNCGVATVQLNAGEFIDIRFSTTVNTNANTTQFVSIHRLSQASLISATETVAARYRTSAGQSIPNSTATAVVFGTRDFDTHNFVNTSTGAITIPVAGIYSVSAYVLWTSVTWATGQNADLSIFVNGSFYTSLDYMTPQANAAIAFLAAQKGETTLRLNAGDVVTIRVNQNRGGPTSLQADGNYNNVTIKRIGI